MKYPGEAPRRGGPGILCSSTVAFWYNYKNFPKGICLLGSDSASQGAIYSSPP